MMRLATRIFFSALMSQSSDSNTGKKEHERNRETASGNAAQPAASTSETASRADRSIPGDPSLFRASADEAEDDFRQYGIPTGRSDIVPARRNAISVPTPPAKRWEGKAPLRPRKSVEKERTASVSDSSATPEPSATSSRQRPPMRKRKPRRKRKAMESVPSDADVSESGDHPVSRAVVAGPSRGKKRTKAPGSQAKLRATNASSDDSSAATSSAQAINPKQKRRGWRPFTGEEISYLKFLRGEEGLDWGETHHRYNTRFWQATRTRQALQQREWRDAKNEGTAGTTSRKGGYRQPKAKGRKGVEAGMEGGSGGGKVSDEGEEGPSDPTREEERAAVEAMRGDYEDEADTHQVSWEENAAFEAMRKENEDEEVTSEAS